MFFREGLSFRVLKCVLPQSSNYLVITKTRSERMSLYTLKKGSLTVETALVLPFFMIILLAFFSFFLQYASAAELKIQAAAEAKKVGIAVGSTVPDDSGEVTIYKSKIIDDSRIMPYQKQRTVTQMAVCRAWIGFTKLEASEIYVYATPEGSVYHLQNDCTHLNLSIQSTTLAKAVKKYRECEHCNEEFGILVYVTEYGECYHSERNCSGLKRTIRRVPLSSVDGRGCCIRCMERGQ